MSPFADKVRPLEARVKPVELLATAGDLNYDRAGDLTGMYRSVCTQAIVLRRERLGEFHKSLALLTEDRGLVYATAYGAYKTHSRLRLGSEPFTFSLARLYNNPVRQSFKVMELEIRETFGSLTGELSRITAASLWAEVVLKSYGAGETSDRLFKLFLESLRALDRVDARSEPYVTIQFLWRFLALAGYQPDLESCGRCGAALAERTAGYLATDNAFVCAGCDPSGENRLPPGALRYLAASSRAAFDNAVEITLEPAGLRALRRGLPLMAQAVLEGELVTLRQAGAAS